jgi:hypothetical protein
MFEPFGITVAESDRFRAVSSFGLIHGIGYRLQGLIPRYFPPLSFTPFASSLEGVF